MSYLVDAHGLTKEGFESLADARKWVELNIGFGVQAEIHDADRLRQNGFRPIETITPQVRYRTGDGRLHNSFRQAMRSAEVTFTESGAIVGIERVE